MREVQDKNDYKEINTPQLVDYSLWEKSGHASTITSDDMFAQMEVRGAHDYANQADELPLSYPGL